MLFAFWSISGRLNFFVIVANESLSCPKCGKMNLKIIQSLLERVQKHKNAGKPNNLWDLKDFSLEQQLRALEGDQISFLKGATKKKSEGAPVRPAVREKKKKVSATLSLPVV